MTVDWRQVLFGTGGPGALAGTLLLFLTGAGLVGSGTVDLVAAANAVRDAAAAARAAAADAGSAVLAPQADAAVLIEAPGPGRDGGPSPMVAAQPVHSVLRPNLKVESLVSVVLGFLLMSWALFPLARRFQADLDDRGNGAGPPG